MREGLKPRQTDAYDQWYGSPVSFSTSDYDAAMGYAASAMDLEDPPVVVHVSEEAPIAEKPDFLVNVHDQTIPPEMLSIMWSGPRSEEGERFLDYRDRISELMNAEYERWLNSDEEEPE